MFILHLYDVIRRLSLSALAHYRSLIPVRIYKCEGHVRYRCGNPVRYKCGTLSETNVRPCSILMWGPVRYNCGDPVRYKCGALLDTNVGTLFDTNVGALALTSVLCHFVYIY